MLYYRITFKTKNMEKEIHIKDACVIDKVVIYIVIDHIAISGIYCYNISFDMEYIYCYRDSTNIAIIRMDGFTIKDMRNGK